jgi:dienelactone hydrolase
MSTLPKWLMVLGCCVAVAAPVAAPAQAALKTEPVEYRDGETVLEGYLAYDDAVQVPQPGILVVHEWMGLGDYAKRRARQLAALGYVAFAADMYGKGIYAKDHEEAGQLAGALRGDRQQMRGRILAALETLKKFPRVDASRLGAIGYCFGGSAALELARSGADITIAASFHGPLETPMPAQPGAVKAKILVFHGADDPYVTQEQVKGFEQEMRQAGADFTVVQFPGAVHSFTVPEAGNDPAKGAAYNLEADRKSWEMMMKEFNRIFRRSAPAA